MHAQGPRPILSSDNSNSAADIDESSIRAGIINQAATYVRRSLLQARTRSLVIGQAPSSRVIL